MSTLGIRIIMSQGETVSLGHYYPNSEVDTFLHSDILSYVRRRHVSPLGHIILIPR